MPQILHLQNRGDHNSTYSAGLSYGLDECVKSGHQKGSGDVPYLTAKSSRGRARDRMGRQWWLERITPRFLAGGIRVPFESKKEGKVSGMVMN